MADADLNVTPMPERAPPPLPNPIRLEQPRLRFTPKESRILKAQTGRTFPELVQDEPFTVMAWLYLRREGWPDLRYADLENAEIEIGKTEVPDPLNVTTPTGWPDSAGTSA